MGDAFDDFDGFRNPRRQSQNRKENHQIRGSTKSSIKPITDKVTDHRPAYHQERDRGGQP